MAKITYWCLISLASLFFWWGGQVVAKQQSDTYIDIVTEHLPPFQIAQQGRVEGFATDIIKGAMELTPFTYNISLYPWSRAYNLTLNKANTCIYSIARTPEREGLFVWVNTIAERNATFVGLADSDVKVTSLAQAKNYRTAVIRDDVTHQLLLHEGFKEGENLYVLNNTHSLLKVLTQRKSIDLILVDANTIKYRAQFNKLDESAFKRVYQIHEGSLDYYLACNKNTEPTIISTIRDAVEQLKVTGEIEKLTKNWQYPTIKVK